jgi:hypothetical protein
VAYGVLPEGFSRKPLPVLLGEIEAKAREVFGDGVIQTPESPLGQLNGMYASLATTLWEIAEGTYQSYDPDQAEGVRLAMLGRIRLVERMDGEADPDFRLAITNTGRAHIDVADIDRAVSRLEGVHFVRPYLNPKSDPDEDGLPGHSVAVAVLGGDDQAVGAAIRPYIVPGIDSWGNARADVEVDGYCRTVYFIRPTEIPLGLQLLVSAKPDRLGCPPPSAAAISLTVANALTGAKRLANGVDISLHQLRTIVSAAHGTNVEVLSATANLLVDGPLVPLPYPIGFLEIAKIDPTKVTVAFA